MKTILIAVFVALTSFTNPLAAERFAAAAVKNIQTYDVPTLLEQESSLLGQIVAVRFQYRSARLRHLRPRWYEASIWHHESKLKKGRTALRVMVDKKDVPAFQTITSDAQSTAEVTLYALVQKDLDYDLVHLRILGRKITTDDAGNAVIDW